MEGVLFEVKEAKGKDIPAAWRPGMPLTRPDLKIKVYRRQEIEACPFGRGCYSCIQGHSQWDEKTSRHVPRLRQAGGNRWMPRRKG